MPKTALLIVLVLISAITKAQKSGLFKFKYLPAHTYEINTKTGMAAVIAMKDLGANAENKRDTNTTTFNMKVDTDWKTTVKTEAMAAGSFPIAVLGRQFSTKTTLNGTEAPGPDLNWLQRLTVKGKIDRQGKMFLDTAYATVEIKQATGTLTGGMPEQIKFPDQQMKAGKWITQRRGIYESRK